MIKINDNKNNIVVLNVINCFDMDPEDSSDEIIATFYLVNPDINKLKKIKDLVKNRFNDEMDGKKNPFIDDYGAFRKHIQNNFELFYPEQFEIEW